MKTDRCFKNPTVRFVVSALALLCSSVVVGLLLLTAVYALPVGPIREHARRAIPLYEKEGTRPEWSGGFRPTRHYTRLDNAVEMMMVHIAATPLAQTPFQAALRNERTTDFTNMAKRFAPALLDAPGSGFERGQYARYWHGYLVFLKPMLLVWTPQEIRVANAAFVLFCFCFACLAARERFGTAGLLAFFAASLFMNPVSACLSLQYTAAFSISALSFAFACRHAGWLLEKGGRTAFFFLAVGILIVFFDFLTFPLATWGLPLAALLLSRPEKTFGTTAKEVCLSLFWLLGYAAMWASKWVAASLFTEINVMRDAAKQSVYRMTGESSVGAVDGPRTLAENWHVFAGTPVLPIAVLLLAAIAAILLLRRDRMDRGRWPCALGLLSVAFAPVVWIFVLQNHSFVHAYMVSKMFAVTVFALLAVPIALCSNPTHQQR